MKRVWIVGLLILSVLLLMAADRKISDLPQLTNPGLGPGMKFNGHERFPVYSTNAGGPYMLTNYYIRLDDYASYIVGLMDPRISDATTKTFADGGELVLFYQGTTNGRVSVASIATFTLTDPTIIGTLRVTNMEVDTLTATNVQFVSGATVGYVWTCTNATTGEGEWQAISGPITVIATNATTVAVDWNATYHQYLSDTLMETNLVLNPTNGIVGHDIFVSLVATNGDYDVTVTNFIEAPIHWRQGLTNGSTSFTVTNGQRCELYLSPQRDGSYVAIYEWFK